MVIGDKRKALSLLTFVVPYKFDLHYMNVEEEQNSAEELQSEASLSI